MSPGWNERRAGTNVEYGRAMGTAVHNIGLADWLTIGFQAEGAKDLAMDGAGFQRQALAAGNVWRRGTGQPDRRQGTRLCRDRRLLLPLELVQHRDARDVDRAEVPESVSRTGRPGAGERRRVGQRFARPAWVRSPSAGRWAVRRRSPRASHKSIRISSDASPKTLKRKLQDALATQHDKLLRLGYSVNVTSRAQLSAERDTR